MDIKTQRIAIRGFLVGIGGLIGYLAGLGLLNSFGDDGLRMVVIGVGVWVVTQAIPRIRDWHKFFKVGLVGALIGFALLAWAMVELTDGETAWLVCIGFGIGAILYFFSILIDAVIQPDTRAYDKYKKDELKVLCKQKDEIIAKLSNPSYDAAKEISGMLAKVTSGLKRMDKLSDKMEKFMKVGAPVAKKPKPRTN